MLKKKKREILDELDFLIGNNKAGGFDSNSKQATKIAKKELKKRGYEFEVSGNRDKYHIEYFSKKKKV